MDLVFLSRFWLPSIKAATRKIMWHASLIKFHPNCRILFPIANVFFKKNWKITLLIFLQSHIEYQITRVPPFQETGNVSLLELLDWVQRERCEDPREYIDQSPRGSGGSSPLLRKLFVNDKEEHPPTYLAQSYHTTNPNGALMRRKKLCKQCK